LHTVLTGGGNDQTHDHDRTELVGMRLTPKEQERLILFTAAELARRRRARGRKLNAPEAIAVISDEVTEAAWDGRPMADVIATGRRVLAENDVMEGVPALVRRVEIDCLFPSGTALVVIDNPIQQQAGQAGQAGATSAVGAVKVPEGAVSLNEGRPAVTVDVSNNGPRTVFISSHYPFADANPALVFNRAGAQDARLDIPAGASLPFGPGEHRRVQLVKSGGRARLGARERREEANPRPGDGHG
jgi:urease subunit gamma/beta